jgi:UDP-N-acetylmuramate--alanine ligase
MSEVVHVHFIGIGGIGMSGLAMMLKSRGYTVSGCDTNIMQPTIQMLKDAGCSIYAQHNSPECLAHDISTLVYSTIAKII